MKPPHIFLKGKKGLWMGDGGRNGCIIIRDYIIRQNSIDGEFYILRVCILSIYSKRYLIVFSFNDLKRKA